VSGSGSLEALVEQLLARVADLETALAQRDERVAELERQLASDSSNSSRPPSSDTPWSKQPAKKRSSRTRSGRKPGKQPGSASCSRSLIEDPDERLEIHPDRCMSCAASLRRAREQGRQRRQVVDVTAAPPPTVTEYQRISNVCPCCGTVTTPGWDDQAVPVQHRAIVAAPGSPVRIGPEALARAALLTCGHYLPVGRSRQLLEALTGIDVSTGLLAGVRGRVARKLEKTFLPYVRGLLAGAPVLHADETTGRAAGTLSYVHVACTEYLTLLHVGGRGSDDIDAGGVLPVFTGCWCGMVTPGTSTSPVRCMPGAGHIFSGICGRSPMPTRTGSCGRWRWPTPCWEPTTPHEWPARPALMSWTR
jgi:transposase